MKRYDSGFTLIVVMGFIVVAAITVGAAIVFSGNHVKLVGKQVDGEKAFYSAAAGLEYAVALMSAGSLNSTSFTVNVGEGSCVVTSSITPVVVVGATGTSGHVISGDLNLDPSTDAAKRFEMQTPTGLVTIATLEGRGGSYAYTGTVTEVKIVCKGKKGKDLTIDGHDYHLDDKNRQTISAAVFTVWLRYTGKKPSDPWSKIKNDWWIQIGGSGVTITPDPAPGGGSSVTNCEFTISSVGTVRSETRRARLTGGMLAGGTISTNRFHF